MNSIIVRAAITSSPTVGSSKIITEGSWTRVRAMETFCFMPVDKASQRRSRKSFISRRPKMASMRCRRMVYRARAAGQSIPPFLGREASVERGCSGKKSDRGAHFLRLPCDVIARHDGSSRGRGQDRCQYAQRRGFSPRHWRLIIRKFLPGLHRKLTPSTARTFAACFVAKLFYQALRFNSCRLIS